MDFQRVVDQLIREAQAEGKFDNLPGRGRPLNLGDEADTSEDWAAHHLLKNNGFRPVWLEEALSIREDLERARTALRRSWLWQRQALLDLGGRQDVDAQRQRTWVADEWVSAQARWRETGARLNQRVRSLNLKVPNDRFQRLGIDVEAELAALRST